MANDFHSVALVTQLGDVAYQLELIIPPDDLSDFKPPPERDENGNYHLPLLQPTGDERHVALGRFIDAWSKVEMALGYLLSRVMNVPHDKIPALANSLQTRGQIDVLAALAGEGLEEGQRVQLAKLLERVKDNSTRRNHLAHGFWMLEILVRDHGGKPVLIFHQYRAYSPTDNDLREKLKDPANRKERSRYMFRIQRINAITKSIDCLVRDIQSFTSTAFPYPIESVQE